MVDRRFKVENSHEPTICLVSGRLTHSTCGVFNLPSFEEPIDAAKDASWAEA
jgi:hypothetical protein